MKVPKKIFVGVLSFQNDESGPSTNMLSGQIL